MADIITPLGGLPHSYASVADLQNLTLPEYGEPAQVDCMASTAPYLVNGKTLIVTVSQDGITSPPYTLTFTQDYATLDLLAAAIQIPGVIGVNNNGRLRLRTIKTGIAQNLVVDNTGTANQILGLNVFFETVGTGRSSISSDITDDEKSYALSSASSIANSYLARRYIVPLKSWGLDLVQAVCSIAGYTLLSRKGFNPEVYDQNWLKRYQDALKWLDDVGNRILHPIVSDNGPLIPNAQNQGVIDDVRGWNTANGGRYNLSYGPGRWCGWLGYGN